MSDTLANIMAGITTAAKKFPLAAAGAPVDIANIVAGGFANAVDMARGKEIKREMGDGLVPKPIGGSDWLYNKFGFDEKSSGLAEDAAAGALSPLSPGGAIKAMVIPSLVMIPSSSVKAASKFVDKIRGGSRSTSDEMLRQEARVYTELGSYFAPKRVDSVARTIVSDNAARIPDNKLIDMGDGTFGIKGGRIAEILDHPELWKHNEIYKRLKDIDVGTPSRMKDGVQGYYDPKNDLIAIRAADKEQLISILLHETQHGVQAKFGMGLGSSPDTFAQPGRDFISMNALYRTTHGEAEARVVQSMHKHRMAPTTFPYFDKSEGGALDVPYDMLHKGPHALTNVGKPIKPNN
jgi:hypothetical protein